MLPVRCCNLYENSILAHNRSNNDNCGDDGNSNRDSSARDGLRLQNHYHQGESASVRNSDEKKELGNFHETSNNDTRAAKNTVSFHASDAVLSRANRTVEGSVKDNDSRRMGSTTNNASDDEAVLPLPGGYSSNNDDEAAVPITTKVVSSNYDDTAVLPLSEGDSPRDDDAGVPALTGTNISDDSSLSMIMNMTNSPLPLAASSIHTVVAENSSIINTDIATNATVAAHNHVPTVQGLSRHKHLF